MQITLPPNRPAAEASPRPRNRPRKPVAPVSSTVRTPALIAEACRRLEQPASMNLSKRQAAGMHFGGARSVTDAHVDNKVSASRRRST